jgi:hypothetical protein
LFAVKPCKQFINLFISKLLASRRLLSGFQDLALEISLAGNKS